MDLNEYEQKIFDMIDGTKKVVTKNSKGKKITVFELNIKPDKTYPISNRADYTEFLGVIMKYIECWGTLELNPDKTKFRRCERINKVELHLANQINKL